MSAAYLSEIFSGIQGEGPWVGQRQIFLRFSGCDLRCRWCDTPGSLSVRADSLLRVEQRAGQRDFLQVNNPCTLERVLVAVQQLERGVTHHSLSLTGGEPLLQSAFIVELLPRLRELFPELLFYLETGGHRSQELSVLLELLDFVSLDLKLPSSTGERALWAEHEAFLRTLGNKAACAKIVLTEQTSPEELERALKLLCDSVLLELVFQPVTVEAPEASFAPPAPEQLLEWQALAVSYLGRGRVRVIPQTHKYLKQL